MLSPFVPESFNVRMASAEHAGMSVEFSLR